MTVFLPKRELAAAQEIPEIEVSETFGAPEYWIDGSVQIVEPEVIHSIAYVERCSGSRMERHEVLRIHMLRSSWARNVTGIYTKWIAGEKRGH